MQLWWLDLAPNSSLCSWPLDLAVRQARLPLDRYGAGLPEIPAMIEGRAWSGPNRSTGSLALGWQVARSLTGHARTTSCTWRRYLTIRSGRPVCQGAGRCKTLARYRCECLHAQCNATVYRHYMVGVVES